MKMVLHKQSFDQSNKVIDWQEFWGDKWSCFVVLLKGYLGLPKLFPDLVPANTLH